MEWAVANEIIQTNGESGFVQVVDEITLTANQLNAPVNFRVRESDFVWTAAVAVSTGTFRTAIQLSSEGERYITGLYPCRSNLFWGTAQNPLRHPPKFLPLNAEIQFFVDDTSGNPNTVALYLVGKRAETCGGAGIKAKCQNKKCPCDRGRWGQGRGLYILSTPQAGVSVPGGAGTTGIMKVPDAYHRRVSKTNAEATNAGAPTLLWKGLPGRIDPRDERRANVASAPMRGPAWTGIATAPARWPSPLLLHKASQLETDYTDLVGTGTTTIHVCHIAESLDDELVEKNG
jgi:hypothetical protein